MKASACKEHTDHIQKVPLQALRGKDATLHSTGAYAGCSSPFLRLLSPLVSIPLSLWWIIIIIIIIIKNEKIRVTLCENVAGALYIVNKMCVCVDGQRNVQRWNNIM